MSEFAKIPVKNVLSPENYQFFKQVTSHPDIKRALLAGGFIAGGFARAALRNDSLKDYLSPQRAFHREVKSPGDVDIFFTSADSADEIDDRFYRSQGGFAKEGNIHLERVGLTAFLNFKVQFVETPDLILPTVEECLGRFDFVNCQVAIVGDKIVFPKGWHELEDKHLIRIANINAPFMGSRVFKYLTYRGYEGLDEESQEHFGLWLIKAATGDFAGFETKHKQGVEAAVRKLFGRGVIRRDDLILFLGKWKQLLQEKVYGGYKNVEVDWALHAIEQLNATA